MMSLTPNLNLFSCGILISLTALGDLVNIQNIRGVPDETFL